MPSDDDESGSISRPWIGTRYPELRLLTLGENLNDHGGFEAIQLCVEDARAEVATGRNKRPHSRMRRRLNTRSIPHTPMKFSRNAGRRATSYRLASFCRETLVALVGQGVPML
jgi:hypothetical protein